MHPLLRVGFEIKGRNMKIGGSRQIGQTSGKRTGSVGGSGSGFALEGAQGGRGVAGLSAAASLAAVDSLLALQEAGGRSAGRWVASDQAAEAAASRAERRSLTLSLFNCPQAAMMSSPRGVRTGLA